MINIAVFAVFLLLWNNIYLREKKTKWEENLPSHEERKKCKRCVKGLFLNEEDCDSFNLTLFHTTKHRNIQIESIGEDKVDYQIQEFALDR